MLSQCSSLFPLTLFPENENTAKAGDGTRYVGPIDRQFIFDDGNDVDEA